jgi:hypothetical protein
MNEIKKVDPVRGLTAADQQYLGAGERDLPFHKKQSIVLIYPVSPQLVVGDPRYVKNAEVGGFVVDQGDKRVAMREVLLQAIGFTLAHPEYTPDGPSNRGAFVRDHGFKRPEGLVFLKKGERNVTRAGLYRIVDGRPENRIAPMINVYALVNNFGVIYSAYGTAFGPAKDFYVNADRLRVKAEAEEAEGKVKVVDLTGCTLGLYRLTSRIAPFGDNRTPVPVFTLAGKLGEPGGPSLAQWRFGNEARAVFKQGLDWSPLDEEPPDPPDEVSTCGRGSQDIGSGPKRWRDEEPPPPTEDQGGPSEIDDIDF